MKRQEAGSNVPACNAAVPHWTTMSRQSNGIVGNKSMAMKDLYNKKVNYKVNLGRSHVNNNHCSEWILGSSGAVNN